jgi:hypothetical protein
MMPKKPSGLKSALELAMQRLEKQGVEAPKLTAAQKRKIQNIEKKYQAKIAETRITIEAQIRAALAANDLEKAQELQERLVSEPARLRQKMEAEKEAVWKEQ